MSKRIKLFLGGYINSTNAQNINCRALLRDLDSNSFDVKALYIYSGNIKISEIERQKTYFVAKPFNFFKYLIYLKALIWADIAYLPKGELVYFTKFISSLFKTKTFKTVEGILNEENLNSALRVYKSKRKTLFSYQNCDFNYSITRFLKSYNFEKHAIRTEEKVLYLGTDFQKFSNPNEIKKGKIQNIITIGRILKRKGVFEILELANYFPDLNFHIVGEGNDALDLKMKIKNFKNIHYHGVLNHENLSTLLLSMDLLFFPSRTEGFPKVTLETACAGVPSILYPDYGAAEWITNEVNGYIVQDVEETKALLKRLMESEDKFTETRKKAVELGLSFDWSHRIKDWEVEIEKIMRQND